MGMFNRAENNKGYVVEPQPEEPLPFETAPIKETNGELTEFNDVGDEAVARILGLIDGFTVIEATEILENCMVEVQNTLYKFNDLKEE